ncbi:MAG: DUF86 domain-containing protein [Methanophagales archaeon ANME-1-THS]|nr:MAG: DUF86 domain-containing protein [Methanophagales archaeon ANME-1-THS]
MSLKKVNRYIHDYFGVNLEAVWDTAEKEIPSLKNEIKNLIDEVER